MSHLYRLRNLLLVTMAGAAFSPSSVAQVKCTSNLEGWSYDNVSDWPTKYPSCCSQTNPGTKDIQQSPINITSSRESRDLTLELNYNGAYVPVVDNGHSIEVEYDHPEHGGKKNYIKYNGVEYTLLQFHFHQPNEHQINGGFADMEVHLVHKAVQGSGLLVIGVLVKKGTANEEFGKVLAHIGGHENLNPIQMIPGTGNTKTLEFYTYIGSLTTPACTPPVTWVVLKEPITFSETQLTGYGRLHNGKYAKTSRGPQPTIATLTVESNFKP